MNANVRAAIYALVGAVLLLLVGYDLLSEEHSAQWLDVADKLLAALALALAYRNTPAGSQLLPGTASEATVVRDSLGRFAVDADGDGIADSDRG